MKELTFVLAFLSTILFVVCSLQTFIEPEEDDGKTILGLAIISAYLWAVFYYLP